MSSFVIAEHNNKELNISTLKTISAAKQFENDITVLVAGYNCLTVAEEVAKVEAVSNILHADALHLEHRLAEEVALLVKENHDESVTHILAPATTFGKDILPRIAALLDVAMLSDVSKIISNDTFLRPVYAGNALATVQSQEKIKALTIRISAFDSVNSADSVASITSIIVPEPIGLSTFVSQELTKSDRPDLSAARVVVSGGRALQSAENFKIIEQLADKLNAAVGASRAAVDAGYVPNDYQVGQTGKIVAPELYIAVGISGAIQHIAGMKDSKVIVAINKDPDAPIFEVADYGLVEDLFKAVPLINESLS